MAAPRIGRPPLFRSRERLTVYLEAGDLRAIHAAARAAGYPAATWARRLLLKAAGRDTALPQRQAARRAHPVEPKGHRPDDPPRGARARRTLVPAAGAPDADRVQVGTAGRVHRGRGRSRRRG